MTHPTDHPHGCIECAGVSFSYGTQHVLKDISFTIGCGEYVGVVGPNGGGKTTLMKLILGLLEPTSGLVRIYDKKPSQARKGGKIGYVPQRIVQADVSFPATVQEIVESGRALSDARRDPTATEEAMKTADVTHLRDRRINALSGGERQRVFIARALASRPHMLILDEPTTGVDPASRDRFYGLLRELNATQHMTIVFVTHDVDVMMKEAKTILCLNETLVCHVPSKTFAHDESLQQLYGSNVSVIHHHH